MNTIISNFQDVPPSVHIAKASGTPIVPGNILYKLNEDTMLANPLLGIKMVIPWIAVEVPLTGNIDTAYNAGEDMYYCVPKRGDVCYLWIIGGQTTAFGTLLEVGGQGALRVGSDPLVAFGHALEAKTTSGIERIKVEVA